MLTQFAPEKSQAPSEPTFPLPHCLIDSMNSIPLKNLTFWRHDTGPAVNNELEFQFIGMWGLGPTFWRFQEGVGAGSRGR